MKAVERPKVQRVVHHSTLVLLLQVVLLVCAVSNNFLVAHMVGPQGKGVLYVLQLISGGFGLPALHFCLGFAAIYFLGQDRGYSNSEIASGIFLPSILLGLLPALALLIAWPWARSWFAQSLLPGYLWLALLSIPLAVLTFNVGQFSLGRHRIGDYNLLGMMPAALLTMFLLLMLISHHISVSWLVAAWFTGIALPSVYAFRIIAGESKWKLLPNPKFLSKAFHFCWRSHLGGVTQQLQHRAPVLLVGYFLSISQLGIYSLAISLVELLWYVPNAISTVLMPHIASSTEEEARRGTPTFCRITVGVTCALAVGLSVVAALVIPWLLPAFRESLRPFYILMPGIVLATIFKVLASDFNGRGRPLKTFYPAFSALAIELVAGCVFIPRFGLTGAAIVTTAGYALNSFLYACSYRKLTGVRVLELVVLQRQDVVRLRSAASGLWMSFFASRNVAVATSGIVQTLGE